MCLQSLGNASVLKTSQLGNSPFYPGKTTYGGAAAARQSKVRITPYQVRNAVNMRERKIILTDRICITLLPILSLPQQSLICLIIINFLLVFLAV